MFYGPFEPEYLIFSEEFSFSFFLSEQLNGPSLEFSHSTFMNNESTFSICGIKKLTCIDSSSALCTGKFAYTPAHRKPTEMATRAYENNRAFRLNFKKMTRSAQIEKDYSGDSLTSINFAPQNSKFSITHFYFCQLLHFR